MEFKGSQNFVLELASEYIIRRQLETFQEHNKSGTNAYSR